MFYLVAVDLLLFPHQPHLELTHIPKTESLLLQDYGYTSTCTHYPLLNCPSQQPWLNEPSPQKLGFRDHRLERKSLTWIKTLQLTLNEKDMGSESENFLKLTSTYTVRRVFQKCFSTQISKSTFFFFLMENSYLIRNMEHSTLSSIFPREACHSLDHMLNISSKHRCGIIWMLFAFASCFCVKEIWTPV